LFDDSGKLRAEFADLARQGERRMSANPHANGGLFLQAAWILSFVRWRRMIQTTAHLVDHIIPRVPVRQWVRSLAIPLRHLNIHLHCLVLDGVYRIQNGAAEFHSARSPTAEQ